MKKFASDWQTYSGYIFIPVYQYCKTKSVVEHFNYFKGISS